MEPLLKQGFLFYFQFDELQILKQKVKCYNTVILLKHRSRKNA
jgi:hypothetical protein